MTRMRVGFVGAGQLAGAARGLLAQHPYEISTIGRDDDIGVDLDLVVETATQQAVRELIPAVIARGQDVLLLSIGALADAHLRSVLRAGPGRMLVCTGAIGGLDQVRALRVDGPLSEVNLESRKLPMALLQPWMSEELQARLRAGDEEIVLAEGLAVDIARQFPASANVAASLALAADAWDTATARVVADPAATRTRHTLYAAGRSGEITAAVDNEPSPERPRSSAVVARAIVRAVRDYARLRGFDVDSGITFL